MRLLPALVRKPPASEQQSKGAEGASQFFRGDEPSASLFSLPQNMNYADRAASYHMREPDPGVGLLRHVCLAAQLSCDLDDLPGSGRSNRMAHREQSSRCAHGASTTDVELPARDRVRSLTWRTQS